MRLSADSKITEKKILHVFQNALNRGVFPPPLFNDENFAYGRVRLTVFRSETEWLIAFEHLVYIGEANSYENIIYSFGNKVRGGIWNRKLFDMINTNEDINPFDFEISINFTRKQFHFEVEDYQKAGIDLKEDISNDPIFDRHLQILRVLVANLPTHDIFLSTNDLFETIGRSTTLPLFLQLYEWCHPDPRMSKNDFLNPCLRSLIRAIANNNPHEYECPSHLINTHWSNWPPYGLTDI